MLSKHAGNCRFPHGHSRKVEFILQADELDQNEMVCDFKLIRLLVDEELARYDHAICLNTKDPSYSEMKERFGQRVIDFESEDPTTEVMARRIAELLQDRIQNHNGHLYSLRESVRLVKVRVWETSSSWAEWIA